ncbi:MAG: methionyl-tRNA formyltransferase [Polymorphobacter sp.]
MRIAFMGTPDFAVPTLEALVAAGHQIVAVYTQPARAANRGRQLSPSPVQRCAETLGIPVLAPVNFRGASDVAVFAGLALDVAVVAAYGLILPQAILAAPRLGCLNVHGSLLPRWRGAAPIQRAILAGDAQTGITIMQMEMGLDTGPMLAGAAVAMAEKSCGVLTAELAALGARLMVETLAALPELVATPQPDEGVTYAHKIDKAEARLDFDQPAPGVLRQIRAFNPAPGAFVEIFGERVKILEANTVDATGEVGTVLDGLLTIACAAKAIRPTLVQRAGKPAMSAAALLNGWSVPVGTRLS